MPKDTVYDNLFFPTGVRVRQVKSDARKLVKAEGLKHAQALDRLAREKGISQTWTIALRQLPGLAINKQRFSEQELDAIRNSWKPSRRGERGTA